jgi:hypothetical protein
MPFFGSFSSVFYCYYTSAQDNTTSRSFIIYLNPPFLTLNRSVNLSDLESAQNHPAHSLLRRKAHVRRLRRRYLGIVAICLLVAMIFVILEAFAAFNIEYCDGEDLMMLYWGFWSVLQVGSIIAIFGVMLQLWIVLSDVETPSWAVALGTPVLVITALVYVWDHTIRRLWKKNVMKEDEWVDAERELERFGRSGSMSGA